MELKSGTLTETVEGITLLIVPYGIEMFKNGKIVKHPEAFNRTLWN